MSRGSYVFLVPGFLGFARLGGVSYFQGVGERLAAATSDRGMKPTIVRVETLPTASVRQRAARLADAMREHAGREDWPIHVVAHSSAGLDARVLLTPGASVPAGFDVEPLLRRVRSLVTLATPHHGTPVASFFDGLMGQRLLVLGSLCSVYVARVGRLPLGMMGKIVHLLRGHRPDARVDAVVANLGDRLLDALPADQRAPIVRLLEQIGDDQALIPQLTPEGIDLLNASTGDRPTVRYGCVTALAPRPGVRSAWEAGLSTRAQASFAVFTALHRVAARTPRRRARGLDPARLDELARIYGQRVGWEDSDGIVPTPSQLWGELIVAARADHLDLIGHFADPRRSPRHDDWLVSASRFGRADFDALWSEIAAFCEDAEAARGGRHRTLALTALRATRGISRRRAFVSAAVVGVATAAFAAYEALRPSIAGSTVTSWLAFVALVVAALLAVRALTRGPPD